jgi:predicted amidohydrolase
MVSQPESVNAQVAECDLLLTGGRVIDPEKGLDDVADVAISGGTVVALGGPAPRGARTI